MQNTSQLGMSRQTLEDLLRNDDSDDEIDLPLSSKQTSDPHATRLSVDQILKGTESGSEDDDLDGLIAAHSKWRPNAVPSRPSSTAPVAAKVSETSVSEAPVARDAPAHESSDSEEEVPPVHSALYEKMLQDALNDRDDIDEAGDDAPHTESVQHVEPVLAELVEPAVTAPVADLTDANLNQLEKAKAVEQRLLSVGTVSWVAPLRHKRRLFAESAPVIDAAVVAAAAVAIGSNAPASSSASITVAQHSSALTCVKLAPLDRMSDYLMAHGQKKVGLMTTVSVHSKIIAIGTSRGHLLVFDHFQTLLATLIDEASAQFGACTALDVTPEADFLIAGHSNGQLIVWDLAKKVVACSSHSIHQHLVTSIRVVTRSALRFVSADVRGNVFMVDCAKSFFSSFSMNHACLFDQSTGSVLTMQALLPPTPPDSASVSSAIEAAARAASPSVDKITPWASVVAKTAKDLASAFVAASARWESMQLCALANPKMIMVAALAPSPKVIFRFPRPVDAIARPGSLPQLSWRGVRMPDARDLYALAEQAVIESALAMGVTQGHVVNTAPFYSAADAVFPTASALATAANQALASSQVASRAAVAAAQAAGASGVDEARAKERDWMSSPLLAFVWGRLLQVFRIYCDQSQSTGQTLTPSRVIASAGVGMAGSTAGLVYEKEMLHSLLFNYDVHAVQWVGGHVLCVLTSKHECRLFDAYDMTPLERIDIRALSVLYHEHFVNVHTQLNPVVVPAPPVQTAVVGGSIVIPPPPAPAAAAIVSMCFEYSMRPASTASSEGSGWEPGVMLFGLAGSVNVRLMPWTDRLQSRIEQTQWLDALAVATELYEGCLHAVIGLPRLLPVMQAAVRPRLTDMLIAYVDTVLSPLLITLAQPSRAGDDSDHLNTQTLSQLQILAAVCVEFCISVHRCDVLFGLIYPKFRSLPGGESVFLQLLEPFIVTGRLNTLSPPVLKAFVALYARLNRVFDMERCMLRLQMRSMEDLPLLLQLCRENKMWSALVVAYTHGMRDFGAPLTELMTAIQSESSASEVDRILLKGLLYLDQVCHGLAFPIGFLEASGSSSFDSSATESSFPLYPFSALWADNVDIAFAALTQICRVVFSPRVSQESGSSNLALIQSSGQSLGATIASVQYPWLYHLLNFAPSEFFAVVSALFSNPKWTDGPGAGSANDMALVFLSNINAQAAFELLVSLITPDACNGLGAAGLEKSTFLNKNRKSECVLELSKFAAVQIARGVVHPWPAVFALVLNHLLDATPPPLISATLHTKLVTEQQATLLQLFHRMRDDLVRLAAGADGMFSQAGFDMDALVWRTSGAKFHQAALNLHHVRSDAVRALDCFLTDSALRPRVFDFIHFALSGAVPSDAAAPSNDIPVYLVTPTQTWPSEAKTALKQAILVKLGELVAIGSVQSSRVMVDFFATESTQVLQQLDKRPELQFQYLRSVLSRVPSPADSEGHAPKQPTLQLTPELHELYVKLMCQYAPEMVLAHVSAHHDYHIDRILDLCRRHRVWDAAAHLLENTGDVQTALKLIVDQVDIRIEDLRNTACRQDNWRSAVARAMSPPAIATPNKAGKRPAVAVNKAPVPHAVGTVLATVPEVQRVDDALKAAIALCQRHSKLARQQDTESEQLWFTLLNRIVAWWRQVVSPAATPSKQSTSDMFEMCLYQFLQRVLTELLGGVSLDSLIRKISAEHPQDTLRAFRQTLRHMLDTVGYETHILFSAKKLIYHDLYKLVHQRHGKQGHAWSMKDHICGSCNRPISDEMMSADAVARGDRVMVFDCGHGYHETCLGADSMERCPNCQADNKSNITRRNTRAVKVEAPSEGDSKDRSDIATMTSIARLDRVLRQEARLPSKLLLLHSCEDDSASSESGNVALLLAPSGGDESKERRIQLSVRQPGTLPDKAMYSHSLIDD